MLVSGNVSIQHTATTAWMLFLIEVTVSGENPYIGAIKYVIRGKILLCIILTQKYALIRSKDIPALDDVRSSSAIIRFISIAFTTVLVY